MLKQLSSSDLFQSKQF